MILRILVIGSCLSGVLGLGGCRTPGAMAGGKALSGGQALASGEALAGGKTPAGGEALSSGKALSEADTACPAGQGIEGMVRVVSGNQMPAPGRKRGPLRGVRSTVYVFELTNISQVVREGQSPYYQSVQTRLVATVDTDSTGHFLVCLPAGHYSLFTKKNGMYYASRRDVDNNIAPMEVITGKMTQAECRVEGDRPPTY